MTISNTSRGLRPGVCLSTNRPANPFDGQVIYETDTDLVKAFNGTDFVTVGPGGLELISTTTIGSAVSSVTVSGAFSATFDNYKITISGGTCSASNEFLLLQLGATTTGYFNGRAGAFYATGAASLGAQNNAANASVGLTNTDGNYMNIELQSPNLAKRTYFSYFAPFNGSSQVGAGFQDSTTAFTAFTITTGAGTVTGGEIRVYGYKN